jgi:radical SAM superfamily enzyme YgiQ (UPF0313 family)
MKLNSQLRKAVLLALDWTRPKDPPLSLGHASILTNLLMNNIQVKELSYSVNKTNFDLYEIVDKILRESDEDTDIGIGAYVWNERYIQIILKELRKRGFKGRIILGGPQISYLKDNHEKFYQEADVFIKGYAEEAMLKLMSQPYDKSSKIKPGIPGVKYANEPFLGKSASINLEEIPSIYLNNIIKPQKFIRWETKRGCPFKCSFCQHRETDHILMSRKHLNTDRIIKEVEWICSNKIIQDVAVLDPTFNSGDTYLEILKAFISNGYTGKLSLQARIEMVKDEFLDLVAELNRNGSCVLEFGLQTIHPQEQKIIERPNNMKKVDRVISQVNSMKIPYEVSVIFGLPYQTLKSFSETIDYLKQRNVPIIKAWPLMLLRGTELYERKSELGLVENFERAFEGNDEDLERLQNDIPHVVSSPWFTYEDWREMSRLSEILMQENKL